MKKLCILCSAIAMTTVLAQSPSGPSPEMKKLEPQNGEWVGKSKNYLVPGEPPQVTDLTMKVEFVMGGMFQKALYFSEVPGMGKLEGMVMTGWDDAKKAYVAHNYNNFLSTAVTESVVWEGEAMVGKTAPLEAFGGMVQHTRSWMKGNDEMFMKIEAETGGQRVVMMEMELKRKK